MSLLDAIKDKVEGLANEVAIKASEVEAKDNVPSEQTLDEINQDPEGAPDGFNPEN